MPDVHTKILTIDGMQDEGPVERGTRVLGDVPGIRVLLTKLVHAHMLAEPDSEPSIRDAIDREAGLTVRASHKNG